MENNNGLGNVKLHVLQFGKMDPDSKESLEIGLELELLCINRLPRRRNLMCLTKYRWAHITKGPIVLFVHVIQLLSN